MVAAIPTRVLLVMSMSCFAQGFIAQQSPTLLPRQVKFTSGIPCASQSRNYMQAMITDEIEMAGIKTSVLGVGAWAWGDSLYWGYEKNDKADDELAETFKECLAQGVTLFDTAEVYGFGRSEMLCGQFQKQAATEGGSESPSEGQALLATKFAPLPFRLGHKAVVDACKKSLERMGTESMALYQLHWPGVWQNEQYWDGLADCVDQGLVQAVGVSNYGAVAVKKAHKKLAARGVKLASNQVQYSLLYRDIESNGVLRACQDLDVKILAYSPIAQGILTGKYSEGNLPSGPRRRIFEKAFPKVSPLISELKKIGEENGGKSPSQVALNWCISKGAIPIPGARSVAQAAENAGALGWRLTKDEISRLDIISRDCSGIMRGAPFPEIK
eukprot:CAMPEP_0113944682 /NCGR_PEP_ID=MMETSP1339-20121228/35665_1 /TAXON_ID=94617 /ORGANISM="Fibrocapsa japonica" /LENGTH=384 /DNA_ID=CAMNT_0000949969 /DNA_START=32 /DNA_END=1186 /DNA_ORIENTATION=+ /assembly_acc=CAM_ASM_000762